MNKILLIIFFLLLSIGLLISQSQDFSMDDSDKDTFYDKLELYAGTNPNDDECKPRKCGDISINGLGEADYFIIILDQSSSMTEIFQNGETRMTAAKKIVKEFIDKTPGAMRIGLYTYGKEECSAFDQIQSPFEHMVKSRLLGEVDTIEASGSTPIGRSLELLRETLKNKKGNFQVLLVTDGIESCQGDPIEEAKKLIDLNSPSLGVKLFIAGVGMSNTDSEELKKIALASQGQYYDISNYEEFQKVFLSPLQSIIQSYKGMVCLQAETDELLRCEASRLNKIKLLYTSKIDFPAPSVFTEEEKTFLKSQLPILESKTKERTEVYMHIKKVGHDNYQKKINELSKLLIPAVKK